MNPTGRTPVLVDGDFIMWESTAIMNYVAEKMSGTILGQSPRERADVLRWQSWQLQHWGAACSPYLRENVVKQFMKLGPPDAAVLEAAAAPFATEAKVLDQHLAGTSHLVADRLTVADFSVASYLVHAKAAEFPLAPYANIARWSKAVLGLGCWAAVAPGR
jgi:glutathione S-transferase